MDPIYDKEKSELGAVDMEQMLKPALTIKDVAEILNVNERTVYRLVQRGEIPAFKVAGAWRVLEIDVLTWIEEQKAVHSKKPDVPRSLRRDLQASRKNGG